MKYETEFIRQGYNTKLINRVKNVGLFELDGGTVGYEVMIIRKYKKDIKYFNGHTFKKGEEYLPSNEDFGKFGWAYTEYENALKKFNYLISKGKGVTGQQ